MVRRIAPRFALSLRWLSLPLLLALAPVAGSAADPATRNAPAASLAAIVAEAPAGTQLESPDPVLSGKVTRVGDGDTIQVTLQTGRMKVRLASIDAPERGQPGGREATAALAARVKGRQVALEVVEQKDGYDRMVAVVWLGDENVNEWLVRQGYAWAYRGRYLHDRQYCVVERAAREAGLGLWSRAERNYAPWEWRRVRPGQDDRLKDYERETVEECAGTAPAGKPLRVVDVPRASPDPGPTSSPPETPSRPSSPCLIKGNVGRSGRIYHLPGSASYQRTRVDGSRGERWFCSEDEARAAGWRAPRD
jgi:endonuclease YncB( thermonuclease family)